MALALSAALTASAADCAYTTSTATINSSCSYPHSTDGVDGAMTISSGQTLTVNSGQTLVWALGSSISQNGTIVLIGTGRVKQSYLWAVDSDGDGWPNSSTTVESATSPGSTGPTA